MRCHNHGNKEGNNNIDVDDVDNDAGLTLLVLGPSEQTTFVPGRSPGQGFGAKIKEYRILHLCGSYSGNNSLRIMEPTQSN